MPAVLKFTVGAMDAGVEPVRQGSAAASVRDEQEAQLRSRFKAAGLWSDWAPGGDAMARALADCPADLWARTGMCPPQRVIMLAATSKRIRGLLAQLPRQVPARVQVKRLEGLYVGAAANAEMVEHHCA